MIVIASLRSAQTCSDRSTHLKIMLKNKWSEFALIWAFLYICVLVLGSSAK